jgi:hypothetical protein
MTHATSRNSWTAGRRTEARLQISVANWMGYSILWALNELLILL